MATIDKDVSLNRREKDGSGPLGLAPSEVSLPDVRSTVEGQFREMEEAHDRIRFEALATHLPSSAD